MYREEIAYLMECADTNKDGLLDYKEFTERFHQPAESIGFHLCVLIVHLSDHLPQDRRLERFKCSPQGRELMEHFQHNMGCIEILGKSKRIERVYFEVKESWLQQWEEAQIQESKRNFLHSVEMGSHKKKLEGFVSFCEDTIFEVNTDNKPRTPLTCPYSVVHDSIIIQYGCSKCFSTSAFFRWTIWTVSVAQRMWNWRCGPNSTAINTPRLYSCSHSMCSCNDHNIQCIQ